MLDFRDFGPTVPTLKLKSRGITVKLPSSIKGTTFGEIAGEVSRMNGTAKFSLDVPVMDGEDGDKVQHKAELLPDAAGKVIASYSSSAVVSHAEPSIKPKAKKEAVPA